MQTNPISARGLSRTIRRMAAEFLGPRIRNALESAADELKAQAALSGPSEPGPGAHDDDDQMRKAVSQDLATLRDLIGKSPARFCDALGDDIEACLMFPGEQPADASGGRGKRRQLRRSEGLEVALLSDEELELSVLISTVGARFERRNREYLEDALKSVTAACGEHRAESLRALIGVFPLINRFSSLIAGVPLSVPSRGRIMNAFQFHVLDELERFYEPLARALGACSAESSPRQAPAAMSERTDAPRPASMHEWMQLLHGSGGFSGQIGRVHPGSIPAGGSGAGATPLGTYLSQVPTQALTGTLLAGATPHGDAETLYDQVVYAIQNHCGVAPTAVPGMDLDVLRLVSLFFETFLSNEALCPALRYLVGRLQLPVLRIALADGSFFDDETHVARRLIETIGRIGIGWSSDMVWVERSPAYQEVAGLVDRILDHPAPDAELFEEVLRDMLDTQAARQEKASRAEQRVVELEVGRSRLKAAKLLVQDELNQCLQRHRGLPALRTFMVESWSKVLTFVCLRHGENGVEWREAIAICDELARLLAPASSRDEAQQRLGAAPGLLERLESLMVEAGLTSSHIDESIARLYREIDQIRESDDDWFASGGEMLIEREDVLEPITLIPPPATPEVELTACAETLDQIHPGTWVRVRESSDAGEFHQVKVAARVAETREILLVDERGARWGIWQEAEFAQAMSEGRIVLVDHELIVQSTLDAMIAALTAASIDDAPGSRAIG